MHSDLNKWEFTLIWVEMKSALKSIKKIQKWLTLNRNKVEKNNQKFENFNWLSFIVQNVL